MIEVLIDHSYEEDYFMIDTITVNLKNKEEKERIEKVIKELGLEGKFVNPDRHFSKRIAEVLGVSKELINIDTNDIDIM
ncbi:hypothetical protein [Halalkalibacter flavus]|uniref:hypothetical protein n=1 Tax=Halalkalibacter flavus TaxID=3090668 RepID=UPI002FC9D344